jgi:hypothetical protein
METCPPDLAGPEAGAPIRPALQPRHDAMAGACEPKDLPAEPSETRPTPLPCFQLQCPSRTTVALVVLTMRLWRDCGEAASDWGKAAARLRIRKLQCTGRGFSNGWHCLSSSTATSIHQLIQTLFIHLPKPFTTRSTPTLTSTSIMSNNDNIFQCTQLMIPIVGELRSSEALALAVHRSKLQLLELIKSSSIAGIQTINIPIWS